MSLFLSISGASHSGKTTLLKNLFEKYPNNVVLVNEFKSAQAINIDEIRKDPNGHIDFQIHSINSKIQEELTKYKCYKDDKKKIVIFDRSLVDSLFYLIFYQDKININSNSKQKFYDLLNNFLPVLKIHFENIYDRVYLLSPLDINNGKSFELFRTKDLNYYQNAEYELMKILLRGVGCNFVEYNHKQADWDDLITLIHFYIFNE
jgi:thymidylate kinase